jgi:DNA-binding winged helix-turn-helix (wHTH) protein
MLDFQKEMGTEKPVPSAATSSSIRRFSVFELDLRTGELRKNGMRLRLQEQPFQVLAMLLERPGDLITRDDLRQKLWPADTFVDFDHGLNTAVNKLREVLADSAASPRYIETLPKRGYRFVYPVDSTARPTAPAPATQPAVTEPAPNEALPRPPRALPRLLFLLLQLMYLAIYIAALAKLGRVEEILNSWFGSWGNEAAVAVLLTAALGVAVRLFLLNATAFDFRGLGQLFGRLFWPIFALDLFWSLSPFLLAHKIGVGLAFAAFATMAWLPFAQRTLVRMAYGKTS